MERAIYTPRTQAAPVIGESIQSSAASHGGTTPYPPESSVPIPFSLLLQFATQTLETRTNTQLANHVDHLAEELETHFENQTKQRMAFRSPEGIPTSSTVTPSPQETKTRSLWREQQPALLSPDHPLFATPFMGNLPTMGPFLGSREGFQMRAAQVIRPTEQSLPAVFTGKQLATFFEAQGVPLPVQDLPMESVIEAIVQKALLVKQNDTTHFLLKLHPAELGAIYVRITRHPEAGLTVQLVAAQEETQKILKTQEGALRTAFKAAQLPLADLSLHEGPNIATITGNFLDFFEETDAIES